MATKIETLRAPRQMSPWVVIGAAAALIAALAVLSVSEESPVTATREPAVTTVRVTSDAAAMAELKSAVAHRYMVERFGIDETVGSQVSEARAMWALKAGIAGQYLAERFGDGSAQLPRLGSRGTARQFPADEAAEIAWLKAHRFGRHTP